MGEVIKQITRKTDKEGVKKLVESYMCALLEDITEEDFAKILMESNKETICAYIIFGMSELRRQQGAQLKIMRKKGLI